MRRWDRGWGLRGGGERVDLPITFEGVLFVSSV